MLLPQTYKYIGLGLLLPSLICAYACVHLGMKPAFLDGHVFAVWSEYFETRYFTVIENNVGEEITLVSLLISLLFIAFAKGADENEEMVRLRFRAMVLATYINTALLIFSSLFFYGIAFVSAVFMNLFSGLILFIAIFYVSCWRYRASKRESS